MNAIAFENLSASPRAGVKGPGAAIWLAALGLPIPAEPNTWLTLPDGLIARLGVAEFLVEGAAAAKLDAPLSAGVYPVLRQDLALHLRGERIDELLLEICSVNFKALDLTANPVVLTSMIGVTVVAIPAADSLRLWCDGTYGEWFLATLTGVAGELS